MKRFALGGLLVLAVIALLTGCSTITQPKVAGSTSSPALETLAKAGEKVFMMPPHIEFREASTEAPLDPDENGVALVTEVLTQEIPAGLQQLGLQLVSAGNVSEDQQNAADVTIATLADECMVVSSSYKDKTALIPDMHTLRDVTGASAVCYTLATINLGASRVDNPFFAQKLQGTSSSIVKLVIVSLDDGHNIWHNEAISRTTPENPKFLEAVRMLTAPANQ